MSSKTMDCKRHRDINIDTSVHVCYAKPQWGGNDMENDEILILSKALNKLMDDLYVGISDPVSYSEDEVFKILGIEHPKNM